MGFAKLYITNNSIISAIYYALLQCGYDFYSIERDASTIKKLQSFIMPNHNEFNFFSEVKQNTCEVYPYWPRAYMLETAFCFINMPQSCFIYFDAYKSKIQSARNISDTERNQMFWNWIHRFPSAINHVLQSDGFHRYFKWENDWIAKQNQHCENDLRRIMDIFMLCKEKFKSPFQSIQIILNPIKCVYSSDYHQRDDTFIFCSGALRKESVIHEFIHHIVHPVVERRKDDILRYNFVNLDIDASYYLNGSEAGKLNAFEEYMVRKLTDKIVSGDVPEDLDALFDWEIKHLQKTEHVMK